MEAEHSMSHSFHKKEEVSLYLSIMVRVLGYWPIMAVVHHWNCIHIYYIKMQFEVYAAMHVASLEYSLYIAVYAVLA